MKFNKILLFFVCLTLNKLQAMELPADTQNASLLTNLLICVYSGNIADAEKLAIENRESIYGQKELNDFLVKAIDILLVGSIYPKKAESKLKIVEILLRLGANPNHMHNGKPLLEYAFDEFIVNMLAGQKTYNKIFDLVKLLVSNGANFSEPYSDGVHKKTVMASINGKKNKFHDLSEPWVSLVNEISVYLNDKYIESLKFESLKI